MQSDSPRRVDLLASPAGRRALFAGLYFVEGAPIGYVWWALPTRLRAAGVPIEDVTALAALLTLPWAFKFLWAPLVDAFRPARGGLRVWVTGAQLAMALTLLPVAVLDPALDYRLVAALLLAHAVCAATQDVAIDALAVRAIPLAERGAMNGWMQVGMLAGRALFGGLALVVEERLGASTVIFVMVGLIALAAAGVWLADEAPGGRGRAVRERLARFGSLLLRVARSRHTWVGLVIVGVGGAGMEGLGAVAGPLMKDRGLSVSAVGWFFALPAVVLMAGGALVGGWLSDRWRRSAALGASVAALALAIGGVAAASSAAPGEESRAVLVGVLALAYLLFGAFTATLYAQCMDLTDPELGGTQFSAYMGAVNGCYVWSAWAVGQLAARYDYGPALLVMAGVSLLALPLLALLPRAPAGTRS